VALSHGGLDPQQQRRLRLAGVDAAIDAALAVVEDANLDSRSALTPRVRSDLLMSLRETLGPPPSTVVKATHPVALHGALLDWHGELLDTLFPERHQHDEPARLVLVEIEDAHATSPAAG
jgi:hypothetical protein